MTVGEKIRYIRQEKGLTQKQLGELCEPPIAESTIRRYEIGKLNPKFETIQKIANALNVIISDLLDMDSIKKEMDFLELYTTYLKKMGCNIRFFKNSDHLFYRIELKDEYVELTYDEFSSLSYNTTQYIATKLNELIQSKTTHSVIAIHNDHTKEPGELGKMPHVTLTSRSQIDKERANMERPTES